MTTDLEERNIGKKHSNLDNWQVLGTYYSKKDAQEEETNFALRSGSILFIFSG